MDLHSLKMDIENFVKYDLNERHHESWTTAYEGERICDYILELIDKVTQLEDEIAKLKGENK